jgi:hypothetical protein
VQVILRLPHVALAQVASEFEDKGAHGILNQTIGGLRRDNDDLTEVDRNEELLAVNVELVGVIGRATPRGSDESSKPDWRRRAFFGFGPSAPIRGSCPLELSHWGRRPNYSTGKAEFFVTACCENCLLRGFP